MKQYFFALMILVGVAAPLAAQPLKIRDHWQKAIYNSPAEWPKYPSEQNHWVSPNELTPCHLHIEPIRWPLYAEFDNTTQLGPVAVQFQLFHCAGRLTGLASNFGDFILDQYGQWTDRISVQGDPNGVVVIPGKFYFNIAKNDGDSDWTRRAHQHGWDHIRMFATAELDNGTKILGLSAIPFFSMRDPTAPEWDTECSGCGPQIYGSNSIASSSDGPVNFNGYGESIVRITSMIPIAPIPLGSVWNNDVAIYAYADDSTNLPAVTAECRKDMDLHHGNTGTPLASCATFDTNELGLGEHKVALILNRRTGPNGALPSYGPNEGPSTLLVPWITVGDGPPLPTCTPPEVLQGGVCVVPPVDVCPNIAGVQATVPPGMTLVNGQCVFPPPPPTWQLNTLEPSRLGDVERLCAADGKCVVLGTLVTP